MLPADSKSTNPDIDIDIDRTYLDRPDKWAAAELASQCAVGTAFVLFAVAACTAIQDIIRHNTLRNG